MAQVILSTPRRFGDSRGWFVEAYNANREKKLGISEIFVQDNRSYSKHKFTIRGIHFQIPPYGQAKLVSCTRGRINDYVVDLRKGSPTYGNHLSVELTPAYGHQLYIPIGFGHGFITLDDETEISYKVSDFYSADADSGIRWDCPDVGIDWPVDSNATPILSDKDKALPLLREFDSPFEYDGDPLQLRVID